MVKRDSFNIKLTSRLLNKWCNLSGFKNRFLLLPHQVTWQNWFVSLFLWLRLLFHIVCCQTSYADIGYKPRVKRNEDCELNKHESCWSFETKNNKVTGRRVTPVCSVTKMTWSPMVTLTQDRSTMTFRVIFGLSGYGHPLQRPVMLKLGTQHSLNNHSTGTGWAACRNKILSQSPLLPIPSPRRGGATEVDCCQKRGKLQYKILQTA